MNEDGRERQGYDKAQVLRQTRQTACGSPFTEGKPVEGQGCGGIGQEGLSAGKDELEKDLHGKAMSP